MLLVPQHRQFRDGSSRNVNDEGLLPWLIRQADLLSKSLHSRIATKQGEFRGAEGPAYPHSTESSHAVQGLQRAILSGHRSHVLKSS